MHIPLNLRGLLFAVLGLGPIWLLANALHWKHHEAWIMMLGGPITALADIACRRRFEYARNATAPVGMMRSAWLSHRCGGALAWIPMWIIGGVWFTLGLTRLVTGSE